MAQPDGQQSHRGRGRRRHAGRPPNATDGGRPQRRPPRPEHQPGTDAPSAPAPSHPPRSSRRAKFGATLTEAPEAQASTSTPRRHRPRRALPPGNDLTSTLIHALRTPPFPDCLICFSPIRPEHPTWSCSPPANVSDRKPAREPEGEGEDKSCCWTTFHLKCIRAWAEKSVKDFEEAWRARGESRPGEWHCPGCRATRQAVPHTYMCFCLRMRHPAPPRTATPHSCAQPCARSRSGCGHPCPLPCHPGPCPPCAATIQVACFCKRERHSAKCQAGLSASSFSCAQPCHNPLHCGNSEHLCKETCHEGPCSPCLEREDVWCWCGRETKRVGCGEVKVDETTRCIVVEDDGSEREWLGSYGCGHPCKRPFACSHHSCSKLCHPPSRLPPPCPFDPERVVACACGRCRVARSSDELAASGARSAPALLPPRTSCTSPLPTCTSPCSKPLPCGHLCQAICHWDSCPPCSVQVERTCRCGATRHQTSCDGPLLVQQRSTEGDDNVSASAAILCDKPCQALRFCGRHQCGRICCPLAPFKRGPKPSTSSKQRDAQQIDLDAELQLQLDPALRALHECDLPCGRVLPCGNHRCPQRDHRGTCGVCPRGVFEELVCPCGRTVLEPPISCGTRLRCMHPCARPAPACGHPHVTHLCHEGSVVAGADTADEGLGVGVSAGEGGADGGDRGSSGGGGPCPPCPFLTDKVCACGKRQVSSVRCSQERVSCGSTCGKLLACGFHHCERSCHADACGPCTAVCGKPRKSCLPAHHPCTQTCHAPAACPETEPCVAPVMLTCACGNLRSTVPCCSNSGSGTKRAPMVACTGECEIKKRNARLAEALGISEEKREARVGQKVTWSPELTASARALGGKFVGLVEKAFADFIASDRKRQVLPHMPPDRRKFVHDLASVYRMDTVMVDQEPHRSVQLIRRIDTRVPVPLLSQQVSSTLGRLVDVRLAAGKGTGTGPAWGEGAGGGWGDGTSARGSTGGSASGSSGAGAGAGGGTGTQGRWSAVASKTVLGASRSGSTTPARVPSPAGGIGLREAVVGEREGSPGPSRLGTGGARTGEGVGAGAGGAKPGVWLSPTVQVQRAKETAEPVGVEVQRAVGETQAQDVPDDWEDEE